MPVMGPMKLAVILDKFSLVKGLQASSPSVSSPPCNPSGIPGDSSTSNLDFCQAITGPLRGGKSQTEVRDKTLS